MKIAPQIPASALAKVALGLAVLAAASGIAFASWIDNGAAIFMAMAETGMAWCF